jgi:tetratricopeptide (TPR) repeat protein
MEDMALRRRIIMILLFIAVGVLSYFSKYISLYIVGLSCKIVLVASLFLLLLKKRKLSLVLVCIGIEQLLISSFLLKKIDFYSVIILLCDLYLLIHIDVVFHGKLVEELILLDGEKKGIHIRGLLVCLYWFIFGRTIKYYLFKAGLCYDTGRYSQAIKYYNKLDDNDHDDYNISLHGKGLCFLQMRQFEKAFSSFVQIPSEYQYYNKVITELTGVSFICGRYQYCEKYSRELIDKYNDCGIGPYALGLLFERENNLANAKNEYMKVSNESGYYEKTKTRIALLLLSDGNKSEIKKLISEYAENSEFVELDKYITNENSYEPWLLKKVQDWSEEERAGWMNEDD